MVSAASRSGRLGPLTPAARAIFNLGCDAYDYVRGGALDLADLAAGRRRPLTPPRRLWGLVTAASNDFHAAGDDLRGFLVAKGLAPGHRVLDVGCGIGRLAVALTAYLDAGARYEGFDIMPRAVAWCRNITRAHPNFRFQLADVHSDRYHPKGSARAADYVFPYPDDSFDFIVLGSVFSHMLPDDLANYLRQVARVLAPGGRAVISCYLLNDAKRAAIAAGGSVFTFAHAGPGYWAQFADLPEAAIAYDEAWMLGLYAACGLQVVENIEGVWATQAVQGQDIVISSKPTG